MSVRDTPARAAVSQVLSRLRSGRIEVVEDGRARAFGPAGVAARARASRVGARKLRRRRWRDVAFLLEPDASLPAIRPAPDQPQQ
jgi:hypothetical protein